MFMTTIVVKSNCVSCSIQMADFPSFGTDVACDYSWYVVELAPSGIVTGLCLLYIQASLLVV